ncbi:MAG: RIP metalloprotease RseP [Gammaproteobacteria bacterium]|nr:RIP metalloprotease RseP [Gammaproteobacteria bacterium]
MVFLQSLVAFLFALGVLIVFHEFGHYWAARRCDVRILRFSVGFGRALWRRQFGPDRTEFVIGALPLGGYVKMLDEREGPVDPRERDRAFNNQPVSRRVAIVAAGPAFNLVFAVVAYWLIYMVGIAGLRPILGAVDPSSIAAHAGLAAGDEIIAVAGRETPTWSAVLDVTVGRVIRGGTLALVVSDDSGGQRQVALDLSSISIDDMAGGRLLKRLGMQPLRPLIPAVIGSVVDGGAASRAGLIAGDRVLAADGVSVHDWGHWVEIVRASPGRELHTEIQRGSDNLTVTIKPDVVVEEQGKTVGRIGAIVDASTPIDPDLVRRESYGPAAALLRALDRTAEMCAITLRVLVKMILGEASVRNLSGPISIAQYAGESAGIGFVAFLGFLAIVSVSLGVLNLLPIPLLDGGHLMYYLIEVIKGSPVSESMQGMGQQVGLAILLGLMGLALYNDILRLIG